MQDNQLDARLQTLEIKFSHQELGLEACTRSLVRLENLVKTQAERIERLETQLRALTSPDIGTHEDPTPPHY